MEKEKKKKLKADMYISCSNSYFACL